MCGVVLTVASREERFSAEQFGENAAHRPQIDGFAVALAREDDLRRAVPARSDVVTHYSPVGVLGVVHTRETEVADLTHTKRE